MSIKNELFFGILIVCIIFFGGLLYTYPQFYENSEIVDENSVREILSDSNFQKIQSFNISRSENGRFIAMTGTLIKKEEELNYIAVFNKLPFIEYYHLAFDSIYRGEAVKTSECIMEIADDVIKTPFLKYNLSIYADVILVKSRINTYFIDTSLLIIAALMLGRKIKKESK